MFVQTAYKKLKIFKKEPYVLCSMKKSIHIKSVLDRCGYTTLHIRIKTISTEVFKAVHDLNSTFMKEMFNRKEIWYDIKDKYIMHLPRLNKITYGKNTFKYYASHILNSNWKYKDK